MTTYANIRSQISEAFSAIGQSAPHIEENRSAIAHEYFVADTLEALAKKRKEHAKKAAEEVGILGDRRTFAPANTYEVYSNDLLTVSAKVATPARRLDATALKNELTKRLGAAEAAKIVAECTKENAAAVTYILSAR